MPKVEWGKKVVCSNCETKFYDLNRNPLFAPIVVQNLLILLMM